MNTRTETSEIVFRRSFVLNGLDGLQPPGIYRVETYAELLDIPTAVAYRRLSTSIELHGQEAGIIRIATIDPLDLEAALRRDAASYEDSTIATTQDDPDKIRFPPTSSLPASQIVPPNRFSMRGSPVQWCRYVPMPESTWKTWISLNAIELSWIGLMFAGLWLMSIGAF